jgi:hypothetical protein
MGWGGIISSGINLGQGAAQNPGASLGGSGEHSLLAQLDPVGKWIVGRGGDPWNLYGEKSNPTALFFPSGNGAPAIPTMLPNLGAASLNPKIYNPGAFAPPALSGGLFNRMTQQMAGPVYSGGGYIPGVSPFMPPARPGGKGASPSGGPGGKGGFPSADGGPGYPGQLLQVSSPMLRRPMPGPRNPP